MQRKIQMIEEWKQYVLALKPIERKAIERLLTPNTELYVASDYFDTDIIYGPEDVIKSPDRFSLMAVHAPGDPLSAAIIAQEIDFDADEMDAMFYLLEKTVGSKNIGHKLPGFNYSPDSAFLAWLTENNPNLKIYVDP